MSDHKIIRETIYSRDIGDWRLLVLWLPEERRYLAGLWLDDNGYVVERTRWKWLAIFCYWVGRLVYCRKSALGGTRDLSHMVTGFRP